MQYVLILRSVVAIALASALVLGSGLAVAQDATPATEAVPLEPLMETTVPPEALPTEPALSFMLWRATIEPGFRIAIPAESVACCPGPQLNHVLAGELTLRVDGPLQVVRAGADGSPAPLEDVPPGTEVILRPGDSAVYRFEFPSEYANAGSERVHFVSGGLFGDSPPGPPGAYVLTNFDEAYPVSSLPSGPVTLSLGRATLAPDAALPAPPPGALQVAMTGPEGGTLGERSDGSFRNAGQEAVVVYALNLLPAEAEAGVAPETQQATPMP